jgi:RHS repeat-associated protein
VLFNGGMVVKNSYDYQHRRVKKEVQQLVDFNSQYPNSATNGRLELVYSTTFVYDRNRIVLETTQKADGTTIKTAYIWGLDLSGTLDGAAGIGGLLGVSIDGVFYTACADATGNITAYVDPNGETVAQYGYDPYGEIILESGAMKDIFKIRFSSKYLDVETSDYNFGRRFYDPWLGRWLSPDPIEERGGNNLYCFAANDPINNVDPLGEVVLVDDALVITAIDAALMAAAAYLATPDGQEKCRLTYDATVNACACACDSLRTVSNDAYKKAQKQLDVAITHLSYLGGGGHGKDPNDRWRNWNKWKSEIRTALENARKKAKGCTTKAKEETLKQIQKLEEQLQQISEKPRGGE